MNRRTLIFPWSRSLFCTLAAFALGVSAQAEDAAQVRGEASSKVYRDGAGELFFAVSLKTPALPQVDQAADVLILFDTSASQVGAYRDDAIQALQTLLQELNDNTRVHLMAVDLNAVSMSKGFASPTGEAMRVGLEKLKNRVPLGSTDLLAGISEAATSFEQRDAIRSIVYIGDGISRAGLIQTPGFARAIAELTRRQISVSSYAIGPGQNVSQLAAIANHTGGVVFVDSAAGNIADRAGKSLARAATQTVYWPVAARLPATWREVFPQDTPPLRGDRDSVLLGTLDRIQAESVSITVEVQGKPLVLQWDIPATSPKEDHNYLPQIVSAARQTDGVGLPTLGSEGLEVFARMAAEQTLDLAQLGTNAIRTGDLDGAGKVAAAVLQRDPNNPQALAIQGALEHQRRLHGDEPELRLIGLQDAPPPSNRPLGGGFMDDVGAFMNAVQTNQSVNEQRFQADIEQQLQEARDRMGTSPEAAQKDLKLLLQTVERTTDVSLDLRAQMRDRIEAAVREAGRRAVEVGNRRALAQENLAAAEERQRLVEDMARTRQKIKQMMDRFNSLMDEGRYQDAEDVIAEQVRELDPQSPTAESAVWASRFGWNVSEMERVREVRHRNFARALHRVEVALVPFPDEPPIMYPEPQVWADLSLRRKKYASIDLARRGSAEERIFEALNDDTRIEFIETPLEDVIAYLRDQHDIPIEIDTRALDDVGIGTDVPISRELKGISLRSALRLILEELELTYIVRDEVLMITTPEEAENKLVTKVYPVGDLVLPISGGLGINPFGGGGSTFGGGGGGFGGGGLGGGGGFGGGGLGGGGFGGGGLGGGGFGGGFFAVEDELEREPPR